MSIDDLSFSIKPKSDQLNADDLIAGTRTVTIQDVHSTGNMDQPIALNIGPNLQPYKPCKSMRRLLIFCWGKDGNDWIGKSMTMFNDPSVKWAGMEVGGIRISHVSGIDKPKSLALTATRGKRKPYTVQPLKIPNYPIDEFNQKSSAWITAIKNGKATAQFIINTAQQKGLLSDQQKQVIIDAEKQEQPTINDVPDL